MRFNYANIERFVEFMEMNALLGVEMTTLYHMDSAKVMKPFLDYYIQRNKLTLIKWILPRSLIAPQHEGQPSLNQDCVLRHMYRTKYLAILDIDETIVPREPHTYTWSDMIKSIGCEDRSVIMARNVFFLTNSPDDMSFAGDKSAAVEYKLNSVLKTWRSEQFLERTRSKVIQRPENIQLAHTHHPIIRNELQETYCELEPWQGALHHYRNNTIKLFAIDDMQNVTEDKLIHKYAADLIERVKIVYDHIQL